MTRIHRPASVLLVVLLTSCASIPSGPSVMALPGKGKTFDQFREDDSYCRQYANEQAQDQTPNKAATWSGLGSAALATVLGAAFGAALGGGRGAAIGAGGGLLAGGLMGANTAETSGNTRQQRYDIGYAQCMYSKGHRIPMPSPAPQPSQPSPPQIPMS